MIEFLNCDVFRFDDVAISEFSVASGTMGSVLVVSVTLKSSDALTDPEEVSLKLDLNWLKDMDPEVKYGPTLLAVRDILHQIK